MKLPFSSNERVAQLGLLAHLAVFAVCTSCTEPHCQLDETKIGRVCHTNETPGDSSVQAATRDGASGDDDSNTSEQLTSDASTSAVERDASQWTEASARGEIRDAGDDGARADLANCLSDKDGDGYAAGPATAVCPANGEPLVAGDCNDDDASAHPGAVEQCGDGLDNDCNGKIDDGKPERCNGIDDDCNPETADGEAACGTFVCRNSRCLTTCAYDADCAVGLHCLAGSCGKSNDAASCSADDQCSSGACYVSGACGPKLPIDSPCDSAGDCVAGATCSALKTCMLDVGSACTKNEQCASRVCFRSCLRGLSPLDGPCDSAADCQMLGLLCVKNQCKFQSGQSCTTGAGCATSLCIFGGCRETLSAIQDPCDTTLDCTPGLALLCSTTNRCLHPAGESCKDVAECMPTLHCTNNVCG